MAVQDTVRGWPWYGQVALFLVIAIGIFWAGNHFVVDKMRVQINSLNRERDALIQEINKGETLKARYIEFEAELKRLENQLDSLKKILPESEEVADLYSRVEQEGTELGLNITTFKPGAHVPRDYYDEWPISMTLSGNYHILAKFFERIGKLYRIINVNDVTIKAVPPRAAVPNQPSLTAVCIATTFIYREGSATTTTTTKKRRS
jgi:type IV pilus assembly protein PilO